MKTFRFPAAFMLSVSLLSGMQSGKQPAWAEGAKVAPVAVGQAPNSSEFGGRVYFAAQPSEADLKEYARLGVKTVINLRTAAELEKAGIDEAPLAKAAGLEYVNVPFASVPTDADLERVYALLNKAENGKILLHCASSNRSGLVWSLYRATQHGVPAEAALAEGKAAGLKSLEKAAREKLGLK